MKKIISPSILDGVSDTFTIETQTTFVALGLEETDTISFWLVLLTDPVRDPCACPPGAVVLPDVADEVQLSCCGEPVILSKLNPVLVLDYPQGFRMRAKLDAVLTSTQVLLARDATTTVITDRLRGCACPA